MVWEIRPGRSASALVKQRADALPCGLFPPVCTPTRIKASQAGKDYFSKTLRGCCQALQKKHRRPQEFCGDGGGRWGGGRRGGVLIAQKLRRRQQFRVQYRFPSRSAAAPERRFRRTALFYRGDKLQVSLAASAQSLSATRQLGWAGSRGLWLTAAPDRAQAAPPPGISCRAWPPPPMSASGRSQGPSRSAFLAQWGCLLCRACPTAPFFFPSA